MRRQRPDPLGSALIRALQGCSPAPLITELCEVEAWASATFIGAVHRLAFVFEGDVAEAKRFATILPVHEFALRGHIVADVTAEAALEPDGATRLRLAVLTVEE